MEMLRTDKERFTAEDIEKAIVNHLAKVVPELDSLWDYYKGNNTFIKSRKSIDDNNNPNHNISIAYGRKIVTTLVGYGFRPGYITNKIADTKKSDQDLIEEGISKNGEAVGEIVYDEYSKELPIIKEKEKTPKEKYMEFIDNIYKMNNEGIKTSKNGKNSAIFGLSYELVYIDSEVSIKPEGFAMKNIPKFFVVDPREVILFWDYSPEPKKKICIRYYKISTNLYKVEVYYNDIVETYERYKEDNSVDWKLRKGKEYANVFNEIPVVFYPCGDDMIGVIRPIKQLLDVFDILVSDSLNEFDRFAHAYLIMKKFGLTNPEKKKEPGVFSQALNILKRSRVFEWVPADAEIKFLTKDVPKEFIEFITNFIKDLIHVISHIPDFSSKTGPIAGVAVQRLMYDFENLVSSIDPEFDLGLYDRLRIITNFINNTNKEIQGNPWDITITHKRNAPLNLQDFAQTALTMKNAGFSSYLIADIMPDDIIPDVEAELERQKEDKLTSFENIDNIPLPIEDEEIPEDELEEGEE